MSEPAKVPTATTYIKAQHEKLREFLSLTDTKVKVEGFPRRLLFGLVDVVPLLCDYVEDMQLALQMIAETPQNGCPACKVASEMCRETLAGKRKAKK